LFGSFSQGLLALRQLCQLQAQGFQFGGIGKLAEQLLVIGKGFKPFLGTGQRLLFVGNLLAE